MYRLIFQRPVHLLSAQMASVSTLFQMFIVLWMYVFESIKKKREFLLWPASESRFLCQHLSTANPIHSCKLCSIKSFNAHFASHQCLMVYGKRERKANKWLYEKRNVKMINGILLPKLFWIAVRKKMFYWFRKTFEIRGWRLRTYKIFEITVKQWKIRRIFGDVIL